MTKCTTRGVITGAVSGGVVGLLSWLALRSKTDWAMVKRVGLPLGLGGVVGLLAGFAAKHTCEVGKLAPAYRGMAGVGKLPRWLKCPEVKGISKSMWKRGVRVEMEHTSNPRIAHCIAASHFAESPSYYDKLEQMERGMRRKHV